MKRCCHTDLVRQIGAEDERWRFYRGLGPKLAPQAVLAGADVFSDVCAVKPLVVEGDWEVDLDLPEVPKGFLHREDWARAWSSPCVQGAGTLA